MPDFDGFATDDDAEQARAALSDPVTEADESDVLEQAESVTATDPGEPGLPDDDRPYELPDPDELPGPDGDR